MKDMRKYKNLAKFMEHNRHMLDVYPRLLTQASQAWSRVDGIDKRTKENEISRRSGGVERSPGYSVTHSN